LKVWVYKFALFFNVLISGIDCINQYNPGLYHQQTASISVEAQETYTSLLLFVQSNSPGIFLKLSNTPQNKSPKTKLANT
jgi:hypothetical protein